MIGVETMITHYVRKLLGKRLLRILGFQTFVRDCSYINKEMLLKILQVLKIYVASGTAAELFLGK